MTTWRVLILILLLVFGGLPLGCSSMETLRDDIKQEIKDKIIEKVEDKLGSE